MINVITLTVQSVYTESQSEGQICRHWHVNIHTETLHVVVRLLTLSLLAAAQVVMTTACAVSSDDKFGIIATLSI